MDQSRNVLLSLVCYILAYQADEACSCEPWGAWQPCSGTCFGISLRNRYCESGDYTEWEPVNCNTNCLNGGTRTSTSCSCKPGYTDPCCSTSMDCGAPTSIINGDVFYTSTYYMSTASYSCDQHYNLTGGSEVRTCQIGNTWSGQLPYCAYVNHCGSDPCENGATCTDLLDDYTCTCVTGWSGKNCETDIQPPVVTYCPDDKGVNATEITKIVQWTEASFTDPFGNVIDLTKNYQSPYFEFPWGDFVVQYTATKLNNGLRAECNFTISVRPTPCDDLKIPANGSRICNGFKTDYGRFCQVACNHGYMIDPTYDLDTLYVCGASGAWSPSATLPDCDQQVTNAEDARYFHPKYDDYAFTYSNNGSCVDSQTNQQLQDVFIQRLTGTEWEFGAFCYTYSDDCLPENVEIVCSPE